MKVSIITVSFNSESTIEETLKSVLAQDYHDIEYIIIDGQSKDRTLDIVSRYRQRISKIVSESDRGLYDALNKGIAASTGQLVGILHSDDCYAHERVVSNVVRVADQKNVDCVYADLEYVARADPSNVVRLWKSGEYRSGLFLKGWMPPHPTFFIRKKCYETFGSFSLQLRTSADYELMLRMLHRHQISVAYLPEVIVRMKTGGQSNSSFLNRIKANREDRLAWEINGLKPGLFTLFRKPLSKVSQYFASR